MSVRVNNVIFLLVVAKSVVGFIKGKSAIWIVRNLKGRQRNYAGEEFWAPGYLGTLVLFGALSPYFDGFI